MSHSEPGATGSRFRFRRRFLAYGLVVLTAVTWLARSRLERWAEPYLARWLESRLSKALGVSVEVGQVAVHLFPSELELRAVQIGSPYPGLPPLVQARRISADLIGTLRLLERRLEIELESLRVDGLELHLNFQEGQTDLLPRRQRLSGGASWVVVRLGYLELTHSVLVLEEERVNLDLTAQSVEARAVHPGKALLEGWLEADSVDLRLPEAQPARLRVEGRFAVFSDRLELRRARVFGRDLVAEVSGPIRWQPFPRGLLAVSMTVGHPFLEAVGYLRGEVSGKLWASGTVSWERNAWAVQGELEAAAIDLFGFPLRAVRTPFVLGRQELRLPTLRARYRGGEVQGSYVMDLAASRRRGRLSLQTRGIPLDGALEQFSVPLQGFAATVEGPLDLEFDFQPPIGFSGRGSFAIQPGEGDLGGSAAVGSLEVAFRDREVRLAIPELWLPGTRVEGAGVYSLSERAGSFEFHLATETLSELLVHLPALDPKSLWWPRAGAGEVGLSLELFPSGDFLLRVEAPELRGVESRGFAAERATVRLAVDSGGMVWNEGLLQTGSQRLHLSGRIPFAQEEDLELKLLSEGWSLHQLQPWVELPVVLSGPFFGSAQISGTLSALKGHALGRVEGLEVADWQLGPVAFELGWEGSTLALAWAALEQWGENATLQGFLNAATGELKLQGNVPRVSLAQLRGLFPLAEILDGDLQLELAGQGTLKEPKIELWGELSEWSLHAAAPGARAKAPGRLKASLEGEHFELELDLPELAQLGCQGKLGAQKTDLHCSGRAPHLERWNPLLPEGLRLSSGVLAFAGQLSQTSDGIVFQGEATELEFGWEGNRYRLAEPAPLVLRPEGFELQGFYLQGSAPGEELLLTGKAPWPGGTGALDVRWQLQVPAKFLQGFVESLELEGTLVGIGRLQGGWENPTWKGQLAWEGGRFELPDGWLPPVEQLEAWGTLEGQGLLLEDARASFGGGRLRARGRLDWSGTGGWDYRFDLALSDSSLRLASGWNLMGGANLVVGSTPEGREIRGQVELTRAEYTQEIRLSPGELLARLLTRTRLEAGQADPVLVSTEMAVRLFSRGGLRVRNRLARLEGEGDLDLRGTLARPLVFGEIRLREGGTVDFGGNRYEVVRARFRFTNPVEVDPLLDVLVRTRREDYEVAVELSGSLSRLQTSFRSNPPLPELEVLALLSGGEVQGVESAAPLADPLASPAQLATSIVYGQAANLVTERVSRLFRLDAFRIDPLTSGDGVSSARVVVGKRISRNLWVTYREDPASTAQRVLEVEWRLSDRWKMLLTQNGNNAYSVDLRWEARF